MQRPRFTFQQLLRLRASSFFAEASESYRAAVRQTSTSYQNNGDLVREAVGRRWTAYEGLTAIVQAQLYAGTPWAEIEAKLPQELGITEAGSRADIDRLLENYLYPLEVGDNGTVSSLPLTPEGFQDPLRAVADLDAWLYGGKEQEFYSSSDNYADEFRSGLMPSPRDLRSKAIGIITFGIVQIAEDRNFGAENRTAYVAYLTGKKSDSIRHIDDPEPATIAAAQQLYRSVSAVLKEVGGSSESALGPKALACLPELQQASATTAGVSELYRAATKFLEHVPYSLKGMDSGGAVSDLYQLVYESAFAQSENMAVLVDSQLAVAEVIDGPLSIDALYSELSELGTLRLWLSDQCAKASDSARQAAVRVNDATKDPLQSALDALAQAERAVEVALTADFYYSRDWNLADDALGSLSKGPEETKGLCLLLKNKAKRQFLIADLAKEFGDFVAAETPDAFLDSGAVIARVAGWTELESGRTQTTSSRRLTLASDGLRATPSELFEDRQQMLSYVETKARRFENPEGVNFHQAQRLIRSLELELQSLAKAQELKTPEL